MQRHLTALLACASLVGLAGCGSDDAATTPGQPPPTSTQQNTDEGPHDMDSTTPDLDAAADEPGDLASVLAGRTFLSSNVDGHTLVADTQIHLTFERGSINAQAGCNGLGGDASLNGATLLVGPMMQTLMSCGEELDTQDAWLVDYLTSQPTVTIDGDTLTIATSEVTITLVDRVVADPDRPLIGTTWVVDGLITGDTVSSVPQGSTASITIVDGSAAVHTGCNRGNASVEIADETLTFAPMATTKMACAPALMDLEFAVTSVLTGDVDYSIEAGRLTITGQNSDGETIGLTLIAE